MALQTTAPAITTLAVTPAPITPATTETFGWGCFGQQGMALRVITTGTAPNVTVVDPGFTPIGNSGVGVAQAMPATGVRMILVPVGAVSPASSVATVTFSTVTGVTYEIYRY